MRNLAIDRLRGTLVILMVAGDFLSGASVIPEFLKHAPDIGITVADLVAPAFLFLVGINFGPSFTRRASDNRSAAYRHFTSRYLGLIGIGAVISAGGIMVGMPNDWGVLQAIGVAGLLTLLVIRFPTWMRFLIGAGILTGYQYLLNIVMLDSVLNSVHGGLFGAVSWSAMLMLSTAVADMWRKGQLPYLVTVGVLAVAAALATLIVPVSKHRISLSYVLITLVISAAVLFVANAISRLRDSRSGLLVWWGQRSLALYLIHLLVLAVFVTPPIPWWYAEAPLWLIGTQLAFILAIMSAIAWRIRPLPIASAQREKLPTS